MRPDHGPNVKEGQPGIFSAALHGFCPRCNAAGLFAAPAAIAETCGHCGLELRLLERGSRWAGVFTLLLALLLIGLAMGIDAAFSPPLWLQLGFWAPVTVGGVIFALRFYKTAFLYACYERMSE